MTAYRPKIVHVTGALDPAGTELWLLDVFRRLSSDRYEFSVISNSGVEGRLDADFARAGVRVIHCAGHRHPARYVRELRSALHSSGSVDLIHSHVEYFTGAVLALAAAAGIPHRIAHSHCEPSLQLQHATAARKLYYRAMLALISRFSTARLAASRESYRGFFRTEPRSARHEGVIPCGIALDDYASPAADPARLRAELGIPEGAWVIGNVARLTAPKNHAFLLELSAVAMRRDGRVHLLLVGDGPLRGDLEAQAARLGIGERVHFAGVRRDVPRLLRGAMDAFVFPSLHEGLGLALVEAQAAGLPCLCGMHLPASATVVGALVRRLPLDGGARLWSGSLHELQLQGRPAAAAMALDAVRASCFNVETSANRLAQVYDELLGTPCRRSPIVAASTSVDSHHNHLTAVAQLAAADRADDEPCFACPGIRHGPHIR